MSDHYYYHLLRNLADTSDSTRRTWFSGFNLSSAGDTALFVFFAGVVSVIFLLYGLSLINCLRATFCPGTLRNRPPTIMMDIDPGLKNLNKKQRRAVLQTFFSVKVRSLKNILIFLVFLNSKFYAKNSKTYHFHFHLSVRECNQPFRKEMYSWRQRR